MSYEKEKVLGVKSNNNLHFHLTPDETVFVGCPILQVEELRQG